MKNLHLIISTVFIIPIAFAYGLYPAHPGWHLFDTAVITKDMANIFRAIMGLYLCFAGLWVLGIFRPRFWYAATVTNAFFMGGLGIGRVISFFIDGQPSNYLFVGMQLELLLAFLAIRVLRGGKLGTYPKKP